MNHTTKVSSEIDEAGAPESVRRTVEFFRRRNLWFRLARNPAVTSCREAAARRQRLGKQGIPLYDELRSYCGAAYYPDHSRRVVLSHCRANAHFDLNALARILGAAKPIARVPSSELIGQNADYGTVNPFSDLRRYVQVFDEDLLNSYTPPNTMITNAGERTWAVEFHVSEVIEALRSESAEVLVGRIAIPKTEGKRLPVFGIITGNGPESGMALWRNLNDEVRASCLASSGLCGEMSYPQVFVESSPDMGVAVDFPDRREALWRAIEAVVTHLCARGVTHIALACHTAHYFTDHIRQFLSGSGVEFVSAAEVARDYLRTVDPQDVTIIGVPAVANLGPHSAYRFLADLGVRPLDCRSAATLQELAHLVKDTDSKSMATGALNRLQHVLRSRVHTSKVLTALTEISVLLDRYPRLKDNLAGKTIIDPLRLYGRALADIYLRTLPQPVQKRDLERASVAGTHGT
jgi:aspartate/glutamate racemase